MAISKTQNERPAITALIDAVNADDVTIGQHTADIANLQQGLSDEVGNREAGDSALAQSLGETAGQVLALTGSVEDLQDSQPALLDLLSRVRIGESVTLTIPANDTFASSETFTEPFGETDRCIVFPQVITDLQPSTFTLTLDYCDESGFSYQIANNDDESHDVKLGYVAVKTNSD